MGYATDCRMADWRYFAGARREIGAASEGRRLRGKSSTA
jgi:hypothetical protein